MRKIFLGILLSAGGLFAISTEAGGPVLDIYPGARPTGLGGAFTAFYGDVMSTYYNDAGLAFISGLQVYSLQHSNWLQGLIQDAYYEYGAVAIPTSRGVVGVSLTYLTVGEVALTDEQNNTYTFVPYDVVLKASYASKLRDNLSFGIGAKFYYSFLVPAEILREIFGVVGDGTAKTFMLDGGILYREGPLSFGLSLLHFGPDLRYSGSDEPNPLPWTVRMGTKYQKTFGNVTFTLAADLSKILINIHKDLADSGLAFVWKDTYKHIGLEIGFADLIFLRGGYYEDRLGSRVGPTFGLGAKYGNFAFDISDDRFIYDFTDQQNNVPNYRFQLTFMREIKHEKKDTLRKPALIVEVVDSMSGKPISATATLMDPKTGNVIAAEGEGRIELIADPATYLLKVENDSYFPFEDTVSLTEKGQTIKISLLKKPHGKLTIVVLDSVRNRPIFASIMIGNVEVDTSQITLDLPKGTYALRVEAPDYNPYYKLVEITEESNDSIVVKLKPITSRLDVIVDRPVNLNIFRGDELIISENLGRNKSYSLGAGTFRVVVSCDGCDNREFEIISRPGHDMILEIKDNNVQLKEGGEGL